MRKIGIYARVSKAEKDETTTSVPIQLADCRQRAEAEGWEVVGEYVDEGITAWDPRKKRPEFDRLLADLKAGRADAILVREQERLLRQIKDAVRVQDLADSGRLKLIASTMESDINFGRARDRDDFRKRASQAQFYSDFLSEKIKGTKQKRKLDGAYTGGGPSFGYARTADGLAVDPEQAALIHEAVRRLGRHESLYRITLDWNAAGITTANDARWRPATLRRMLTGAHLTGGNGYPPILDPVEAAIIRQELGEQPKLRRGRPIGRRYPLVGFMRCAECGTKLIGSSGAYRCGVSHGGCGGVSIRATPVERHLLALTVRVGWRRAAAAAGKEPAPPPPPQADTAPLLAELREVESRLEEVAAGLADGTLSVRVAGPAAARLEERQRAMTDELARNLPPPERPPMLDLMAVVRISGAMPALEELGRRGLTDLSEPDPDFRARWDARSLTEAEVAQLRDLFMVFLDTVTVARRERRGRAFDPGRLAVSWRSA